MFLGQVQQFYQNIIGAGVQRMLPGGANLGEQEVVAIDICPVPGLNPDGN